MKRAALLTFYFLIGFCISFFITIACKADVKKVIVEEAVALGFDPALALAVAEIESSFNPKAVGSQGEIGLFQLHPRYFKNAPVEPRANARLGIKHLLYWEKRCSYKSNKKFVLCYNRGMAPVVSPKTAPYYKKVMRSYRGHLSQRPITPASSAPGSGFPSLLAGAGK